MAGSSAARISHKTDAVMKLITGKNTATNPIIDNEFKQSVIEMHSNSQKKTEKAVTEVHEQPSETTEICVSSELITELLPIALKRFNCCTCDRCFAEAMAEALEAVPFLSCKVKTPKDKKKADEMKKKYTRSVTNEMVRIAINRRALPKHKTEK
ncbi:MAG: hypothetical protein ACI4SF_02620 [Oscillospiraceae bacterium]